MQGGIDLIAKLLLLSPRHFVELPQRPWLTALFDAFGTARGILDEAAKATGLPWSFKGPIFTAEWFGTRDTWVMEVQDSSRVLDSYVSGWHGRLGYPAGMLLELSECSKVLPISTALSWQ